MGWDPPEPNYPACCEECEHINEATGECPLADHFEYCPHVDIIKRCQQCGKPLYVVPGLVPKEHIAYGYEWVPCCSKECAAVLQEKFDREIAEMIEEDKIWQERMIG